MLPAGFASALHVYFPDPWPKSRHHKRRLFDPETVDLVLRPPAPGRAASPSPPTSSTTASGWWRSSPAIPALRFDRRDRPWDEGPRTNYEAKYEVEGRPILRLEGVLEVDGRDAPLHPLGAKAVLAATFREEDD